MQPLSFYNDLYSDYMALKALKGVDILYKVPDLGRRLKLAGFESESSECFEIMVRTLTSFASQGNAHGAIICENLIYNSFVKTTETEEHYAACFSRWTPALIALGRSHCRPLKPRPDKHRICFVLQAAVLLGHTQVMFTTIDAWRAMGLKAKIVVAALGVVDPAFLVELERREIPFIPPTGSNGEEIPIGQSVLLLRDRLEARGIHTVVWASSPSLASYALSLQLAPRQILWSVKFHPVFLDSVDVHICGGHESETSRSYHGHSWTVSPFPLTLDAKVAAASDVAAVRSKFPEDAVLCGALAREEKFNSPAYLMMLGSLLSRNPKVHFIWTGRSQPEHVTATFKTFGIAERCHFVGWVDTNLYAAALDIFLETFPFGCGITGFQAMSHGTALLSMRGQDTLYGLQLEGASRSYPSETPISHATLESLDILTAADLAHYLDLARRLIDDASFRKSCGDRERAYVARERAAVPTYAKRLWTTITGLPV